MKRRTARVLTTVLLVTQVHAIDNGLGLLPPRAWRSWNAFHTDFNQSTIVKIIDELVKKRAGPSDSAGTSLQDLGYNLIGIDEGWEGCGMGINHTQQCVFMTCSLLGLQCSETAFLLQLR